MYSMLYNPIQCYVTQFNVIKEHLDRSQLQYFYAIITSLLDYLSSSTRFFSQNKHSISLHNLLTVLK